MRKLILQIRYTIFSRSLCVRHLQTILPYSPYLYGIFTIYSNFTPHTRIYFCKAESFFAELELTFSIHLKKWFRISVEFALEQFGQKITRLTKDCSRARACRQFFVGRMQIRVADTIGRLELTTKGGKCGCSSSILSFRNYNDEKRCTKIGEILSCVSFHLFVSRV